MSRLSSKTGSKGASAVRRWIRPGELDPRSFISFRIKTMSRLDFYTFSLDAQPPLKKSVLHVGSLTGDLKKSTIFISIDRRNRQIPFSRANRTPSCFSTPSFVQTLSFSSSSSFSSRKLMTSPREQGQNARQRQSRQQGGYCIGAAMTEGPLSCSCNILAPSMNPWYLFATSTPVSWISRFYPAVRTHLSLYNVPTESTFHCQSLGPQPPHRVHTYFLLP